jgi:5,10-methylenetetrahydromethanopterin reductase
LAEPRFGIGFQTNKSPAEYAELAQLVDRYAFDVVSAYNDLMYQPAIGPLLLMAPHVRRAQIGPAVTNPFIIHPVEIAGQVAVLDAATDGRAYLGLGRGAWLDAIDREPKRPLRALREAVLLVKQLLRGDDSGFEGQEFRLVAGAAFRFPIRRPDVPILIGTWGVETARLAGELADEVKIGGSANGAMVGHLRPHVDAGSQKAGRAAGSVGICLGGVTVVDHDREAARALARRQIAPYVAVIGALDPSIEERGWLNEVAEANRRGDVEGVVRAIPDEMLERFAFAGSPEDIVRQAEAAFAGGATRVEFGTPHGRDEAEAIRLLGERVLPYFRG